MEYSDSSDKSEQRCNSLAARLKAGNRAAAAELVDIYYEQIYVFMRRLGHSCQVSEDLTQESFLAAWQHIGQLRSGKTLNSWMYRIAGNVSRLYWRRHKDSKAVSIEGFDAPDGSEPECDKTGHLEQLGRLKNAVAKLPVKSRQVVVLHYMQHLTIAEAAEAAGVRCGTFKSRLNKALKILKSHLIAEDGELL
jgi:RNA polymerase sigma-70 factor (ECF subfamily)